MLTQTLLASALALAFTALPVSSSPSGCTPDTFPESPVPGGVVGFAWNTTADTYDSSPAAGACAPPVRDTVDYAVGAAAGVVGTVLSVSCHFLIGTDCTYLICGSHQVHLC